MVPPTAPTPAPIAAPRSAFPRSPRTRLLLPHPGQHRATAQASPPGTAAGRNNSAADSIAHIEEPRRLELQQASKMLCNIRARTEPFQLLASLIIHALYGG